MERLGYTRYVAQGGDWGNAVTEQMALLKPEGLLGIHTNMPATVPPDVSKALALRRPQAGRPLPGRETTRTTSSSTSSRPAYGLRRGDGQPSADPPRAIGSTTIHVAINPATVPSDLRRPGHVFPLRARPGGVLQRVGHTEASVDLARLAGLLPAGVICEILNEDGSIGAASELEAIRRTSTTSHS